MVCRKTRLMLGVGVLSGICVSACGVPAETPADDATASAPAFACDADDGGLTLPEGFCATVFADDLGIARPNCSSRGSRNRASTHPSR